MSGIVIMQLVKPLFWVAINSVGFIILVYIYNTIDKTPAKKTSGDENHPKAKTILAQSLFGYFVIVLMLFLIQFTKEEIHYTVNL